MSKAGDRGERKHYVLMAIEKLEHQFPGLLTFVKRWLDQGVACKKIPALVQKTFQATVTEQMVERFRAYRWVPEKLRMEAKRAARDMVIEAIGGDAGFDSFALAKLWESMDDMSVAQLMSIRQMFLKIRAQNLKEEEFKLKSAQLQDGKSATGAVIDPAAEAARRRHVMNKIRGIFGLSPLPEETNEDKDSEEARGQEPDDAETAVSGQEDIAVIEPVPPAEGADSAVAAVSDRRPNP